jgi:hypothetical protein
LECSFTTRPFIFDAQPPRPRHPALRPSRLLPLTALMLWASSVACLWTNESRLIFQAGRSRQRLSVLLELPGGHNDAGFMDDSPAKALAQFWPAPR